MKEYNCIVVLGPTASGKTRLACKLAYENNGEIISADSRQVYKHLDIGTGKDLEEYTVNNRTIPYHLIDLVEPAEQFYLHQFIEKLEAAFHEITGRGRLPVVCGGTGLYLDALRKDFSLTSVKENAALRLELEPLSKQELVGRLLQFPRELISHVDVNSKKRIVRGIEVASHQLANAPIPLKREPPYKPIYLGIDVSLEERKNKISERLNARLNAGLIEEVERLLSTGITHQRLETLGLEYKFVSYFLQHKISREELHTQLFTAIAQFSKRQMTWFRKMEKEGVKINWVPADSNLTEVLDLINYKA